MYQAVSPARHSTASAPCAGAGSITSGPNVSVIAALRPSRASPAAASTTASTVPSCTRPSRVSTLPRTARTRQVGPHREELGRSPGRAGADRGAPGKSVEGQPVPGAQRVGGIFPAGHRGQRDALGRTRSADP